jgi:hypothetical protein
MVGLVLLSILTNVIFGSKPAQAASGAPVVVTNTPLPVSAAQGGSWNVNVANTPGVNVSNTPSVTIASGAAVRDADNPARQNPILGDNTQTFSAAHQIGCGGTEDTCTNALFQVPTGKRLVLEYASVKACLTAGQVAVPLISINPSSCQVGTSCGVSRLYYMNMTPAAVATDAATVCPASGDGITSVGQSVRIYADAGEVVVVGALRNKGETGSGGYLFGLSGYLVDIP